MITKTDPKDSFRRMNTNAYFFLCPQEIVSNLSAFPWNEPDSFWDHDSKYF